MKKLAIIILLVLLAASGQGHDDPVFGPDSSQTTVQATVEDILISLSDEDKATIPRVAKVATRMTHQ